MIKKAYQKPMMKVEEVQDSQIICSSLTEIKTTGLDAGESLHYGDDNKRNGSVWDESW